MAFDPAPFAVEVDEVARGAASVTATGLIVSAAAFDTAGGEVGGAAFAGLEAGATLADGAAVADFADAAGLADVPAFAGGAAFAGDVAFALALAVDGLAAAELSFADACFGCGAALTVAALADAALTGMALADAVLADAVLADAVLADAVLADGAGFPGADFVALTLGSFPFALVAGTLAGVVAVVFGVDFEEVTSDFLLGEGFAGEGFAGEGFAGEGFAGEGFAGEGFAEEAFVALERCWADRSTESFLADGLVVDGAEPLAAGATAFLAPTTDLACGTAAGTGFFDPTAGALAPLPVVAIGADVEPFDRLGDVCADFAGALTGRFDCFATSAPLCIGPFGQKDGGPYHCREPPSPQSPRM